MEEILASVQVRRDTKANWETINPILLEGEAAYELDTDMFKIGDGVKRYSDLPYHNKVGPQGPQGEPGPQGEQGPAGERYDDTEIKNVVNSLKDDLAAETRRAKEAEDNRIKKFYTSNLGTNTIADSDDGAVRNLVIGGRCEQVQTIGYNLCDGLIEKGNINPDTMENVDASDRFRLINYINNPAASYLYVEYDRVFDSMSIYGRCKKKDGSSTGSSFVRIFKKDNVEKYKIVLAEETEKFKFVFVTSELVDDTTPAFVKRIMVSVDDVPYEPYTGGAPSPSPDYPQEIKCVEGCTMTVSSADGTKIQEAAIPFALHGNGDVRDELYVYADGTGKLVRRYPETLDPTRTVAEQALETPVETTLTADQVNSLFDLRTYYGGTNIAFASDNGVEPVVNFDYACALDAFVEYVKAQQGDTREMIYDMDDRLTQAEVTALEAAIDAQIAQAMMEV